MMSKQPLRIEVDDGWEIAAWLTVPATLRSPLLQILVHGATYTHHYWDFPYQPERYSYVDWATEREFATLNIDRLGSGASSRPPGTVVDTLIQARALNRLAELAQTGLGPSKRSVRFDGAVIVAHSLGSIITGLAAATSDVVSAVVLTGTIALASGVTSGDPRTGAANFHPALEDPVLADLHPLLDDGYFTVRPDARRPMWFHADATDPVVVEVDERLKDTLTAGEILTLGPAVEAAAGIRIPALCVVGQYDALMFDPAVDTDTNDSVKRAAHAAPENFEFRVIPATGHNLNLHRNAHVAFQSIGDWLADTGGTNDGQS